MQDDNGMFNVHGSMISVEIGDTKDLFLKKQIVLCDPVWSFCFHSNGWKKCTQTVMSSSLIDIIAVDVCQISTLK